MWITQTWARHVRTCNEPVRTITTRLSPCCHSETGLLLYVFWAALASAASGQRDQREARPMQSKYRSRKPYGERLEIALTPEQKRRAFELADQQNISVGALVRR